MEVRSPHDVRRYKTAVEEHREEYVEVEEVTAGEVLQGQRVRDQRCKQDAANRTDDGDKDRQTVCAEDGRAAVPDISVSRNAEFCGEERVAVVNQCVFIRNRAHKQQDKRRNHDNRNQHHKDVDENLVTSFTFR